MNDFSEVSEIANRSISEILEIRDNLYKTNISLTRRIIVTQVFVQMEILSNLLKSVLNNYYDSKLDDPNLPVQDFYCSLGEDYLIEDDGTVVTKEKKIRTIANILYSLRFAARVLNKTIDPCKIDKWPDVKPSIKIRDRITHPKHISDLNVTEEEMGMALNSIIWFMECLHTLEIINNDDIAEMRTWRSTQFRAPTGSE